MARVGVYLTTYANATTAKLAAESVLGQSYQDLELLVFDNHSPDNTLAALGELVNNDLRIKIVPMPKGLAGIEVFDFAWKYLDEQDYDYTITLGGHDYWNTSDTLKNLVARMDAELAARKDPESIALVYMPVLQVDPYKREICGAFQNFFQLIPAETNGALVPLYVILGVNSPQLFGLWNEKIRKQMCVRYPCVGWDHLVVMEASTRAGILFEGGAQLVMQAPPRDDSPEKYGLRHLSEATRRTGPMDFINQLEWCIYCVDRASEKVPPASRATIRMLNVSSICAAYLALRGYNLQMIPHAGEAFAQLPLAAEGLNGLQHASQVYRALTRACKPQVK